MCEMTTLVVRMYGAAGLYVAWIHESQAESCMEEGRGRRLLYFKHCPPVQHLSPGRDSETSS